MNFSHGTQEPVDEGSIGFSLSNRKAPTVNYAYVYMTVDSSSHEEWGRLQFTIENTGTTPIEMSRPSRLEISIPDTLMSKSDLERIGLETDGPWTLRVIGDDALELRWNGEQALKLLPREKYTLGLIHVFASMGTAAESAFAFEWYGFGGLEDDSRSFKVLTLAVPDESTVAKLEFDWVIREEYVGLDTVYVTPYPITTSKTGIANRLLLRITNSDDALANDDASIRVTFFTEEYGSMALLTADQLKDVKCKLVEPADAPWECVADTTGKATSWILKPRSGEKTVLAKGGLIVFELYDLVTQLGGSSSPVLFHWGGMKNRNPGQFVRPVTKTAPTPYVRSYTPKKDGVSLRDGQTVGFKEEVSLEFNLFAADSYLLEAFSGERFLAPPFVKTVRPDRAVSNYKLTPTIELATGIRPGQYSPFHLLVSAPTASLSASIQSNGNPKLVWECTHGDCFLSGPNLARTPVDRRGEREVTVVGTYEIECAGITTVKARVFARRAHPFCTVSVSGGGPRGRVSYRWSTSYATSCDVEFRFDGGGVQTSRALSGDSGGFGWPNEVTFVARGNGTATLKLQLKPWANLPNVSFVEEKLPDSAMYQVRWNLPGGRPQIVCKSVNDVIWSSGDAAGDVTKDYAGRPRTYMMSAEDRSETDWNYNMKIEPLA